MEILGTTRAARDRAESLARDGVRGLDAADVRAVALGLVASGAQEATHLAYGLLDRRRDVLDTLTTADVRALGPTLDNWATVDTFCVVVAGQLWRRGRVGDAWFRRWAASKNRWRRRAALVSTVALNQKSRAGAGDPARTLALCEALVADRDDMVVKAMSWALRELSKRDADAVRGFLARHGDAVAARVRREVRNKLATGRKNPR
jgi:3-methyladenine DNA glycosylase AlkD